MTYQDALAVFSAVGRLVDHDETGALIRVNGEERLLTRGQVSAGAAALLRSNPNLDAAEEDPPTPWPAISTAAGYAAALTVCRTHAEDLIGWEEAWCPFCHELDDLEAQYNEAVQTESDARTELARLDMRVLVQAVSQVAEHIVSHEPAFLPATPDGLETLPMFIDHDALERLMSDDDAQRPAASTTSGGLETNINVRSDPMTFHDCSVLHKRLFAAEDGYCRHCRSVELAAQILDRDEPTGPSFAELLEEVGGEDGYRASLEDIRTAKHDGRVPRVRRSVRHQSAA
jgi:hypothetical protein